MTDEVEDVQELEIKAIIGFDGANNKSFTAHPDGKHIVYALGNKVAIMEWSSKKQRFLVGHTNIISCVTVSPSGLYIASGQINHIGFRARVIVWDYAKMEMVSQHEQHKVRVEAIVFASNDNYVFSLGGRDCGSVIVWDIRGQQVVCGSQVSRGAAGDATSIDSMSKRGEAFITGGDTHLSVWIINKEAKSVKQFMVHMAKRRRTVLCLEVNERDEVCYCGTSTGDLLKVRLYFHHDADVLEPVKTPAVIGCWAKLTKKQLARGEVDLYQNGIRAIKLLFGGLILIGAGDGTVELVEELIKKGMKAEEGLKMPSMPALKVLKGCNVNASVTAIQQFNEETILVGTISSEIYLVNMKRFQAELVVTCHTSNIYDIAFPFNFSEVFATAGKHDVRIWSMATMQELLRIRVQNFSCTCLVFAYDGKSLLSGWSDGVIRAFTPLTGKLIFAILDAHNKGLSAITCTKDGKRVISGGCEGQVRLWDVSPFKQQLVATLKEHKGPVSAIDVNKFDSEAASASTDGTCIIWDLQRQCRRQILFANTLFMCVKYFPSGVQMLTGGSDRKLSYWEVLDGSLVRELEGSPSGTINCLDITADGSRFVSGGNDQIVKVWTYQEGISTHIGVGHAGAVTAVRFSGDGKSIVTCDASGCVFVWKAPACLKIEEDKPPENVPPVKLETVREEPEPADGQPEEENIRDLPTVRSSIIGAGDARLSPKPGVCECDTSRTSSSSKKSCRMRGGGDGTVGNAPVPDTSRTAKSVQSVRSVKSNASVKSNQSVKSNATVKSQASVKSSASVRSNATVKSNATAKSNHSVSSRNSRIK